MSTKIDVEMPVRATLGTFSAILLPHEVIDDGPEDFIERPWAWLGSVAVTFWIGNRRVTKRLRAKATLPTIDDEGREPTFPERWEMFDAMVAGMRRELEAHGLSVGLIGWEVLS